MTVSETFRIVAPEFETLSEDEILMWISLAEPYVSKKQFGKLYNQALAFLTAHMMKLSGKGDQTYGSVADALRLSSVSEGNTSVSFNTGMYATGTSDAELCLTPYGLSYKKIRQMCVIPVISSGGR